VGPASVISDGPEREGVATLAASGRGTALAAYSRFLRAPPYDARRAMARYVSLGEGGSSGTGGGGGAAGAGGGAAGGSDSGGSAGTSGGVQESRDSSAGGCSCSLRAPSRLDGAQTLLLVLGALLALRRRSLRLASDHTRAPARS
jgi:hypothetical protein